MESDFFRGKTILILSPQPWHNLFLSKHNYARALAKDNKVIFIGAPAHNKNFFKLTKPESGLDLEVLEYGITLPVKIKFHWPWLYHFIIKYRLHKILADHFQDVDVCIDFGCYQQYNSIDWIPAKFHIYFPVDDHHFLKPQDRGADLVLSISENICSKFSTHNKKCHFINHGLNKEFEENAVRIIKERDFWNPNPKINVAYSGSLFIPFLDIPVLQEIIQENPQVDFHFFGDTRYNKSNLNHRAWDNFLRNTTNVKLHGFLHPIDLVKSFNTMDAFLLCYKPDYKNYHAENSHKVFEYLSTGRVLITTYLSIYQGTPLMLMSEKDKNEELKIIFSECIYSLERYNTTQLQKERIKLSLDNTYNRQIDRIGELIRKAEQQK